jgi:hypothetical protein
MGLQDQGHTFDGGSIRAFAAFHQALLEQFLRIRELGDALARCALAAKVIRQAFAVRGLRKHARKRKFADTASAGKEQRMRDAAGAQSAAKCGDDAFVAEKVGEGHLLSPFAS